MKEPSSPESEPLRQENARLRGDLLTIATRISHDLRTPLGSIVTAAEALQETAADEPSTRSLTRSLMVSVDELSKLIRDVSFVLKATAHPLPREPLKMDGVFACALQRLERQILNSSVTVVTPPSWPAARGVAAWTETIWTNLLSHFVQRSRPGETIEAGARQIPGEKQFLVRGRLELPEDQRDQLFQPFESLSQLDNAGTLGLAIARRLVELQGGRCGCDSATSLFFTLPD